MQRHYFRAVLRFLFIAMAGNAALAATEQVLHSFNPYGHGGNPQASLIADSAGNLYGTASTGGSVNGGLVFKLTPTASGQWKETILHDFQGGTDGLMPLSGLVFDKAGNLFGTTYGCGSSSFNICGIAFELSPNPDGSWTEKIIHQFGQNPDGAGPQGNLVFDSNGNLYGTTQYGGIDVQACGTVFELSPAKKGAWTETVLHSFACGGDGGNPLAGVVLDSAGNLYGTTSDYADNICVAGPFSGCGTVFRLTHSAGGKWSAGTLFRFNNLNGGNPSGGLIFDSLGNLYGTTLYGGPDSYGGPAGYGVVFELLPSSSGTWTEKVLWNLYPIGNPLGSLVFDASGNLYGTASTSASGNFCGNGCGSLFKLAPSARGNWTPSVIYDFAGNLDGSYPAAGLILDATGNLYGTTEAGGGANCTVAPPGQNLPSCGTVFKLTPSSSGPWTETQLYNFPGTDGNSPDGLISDGMGNFYGTTVAGGAYGWGEVFKLVPSNGTRLPTTLYSFTGGSDGGNPNTVILDAAGNLFGSTQSGGTLRSCGVVFELSPAADGIWNETVLHEFPGGNNTDGCVPANNLVFDPVGNLYGATLFGGGLKRNGVIFKLAPSGGGQWTETVLHRFPASTYDGAYPSGGLVLDAAGNLFGTTGSGGSGCNNSGYCGGTAFQLSPDSNDSWTEKVIYNFQFAGSSGYSPYTPLISDSAGNLYGTTNTGGRYSCGTVFELSPSVGLWNLSTLYNFGGAPDGCAPYSPLSFDTHGNLYGTTYYGGDIGGYYGAGTVFELSPSFGNWNEKVLYTFTGSSDGAYPDSSLIVDGSGHVFGTAGGGGGPVGIGVVFEIVP